MPCSLHENESDLLWDDIGTTIWWTLNLTMVIGKHFFFVVEEIMVIQQNSIKCSRQTIVPQYYD